METKVQLNKNTFEVNAQKGYAMTQGTIGGYAFNSEADYYIVVDETSVSLKSVFIDVEYISPIEQLDSINRTFKIKDKEFKYKIID